MSLKVAFGSCIDSAESDGVKSVGYSTFNKLWKSLVPSITIMKPMSDLCWSCQQNSTAILRAANKSEVKKSATLKNAEDHLFLVQLERSFYKTKCDSCKSDIHSFFSSNGNFSPPPLHSNTEPNLIPFVLTTHLTMHNKSIIHQTLCNLGQSSF